MKKMYFDAKKEAKHYIRSLFGAFTLAEVLITLAIIGVVAALTIPTLISNYQKKVIESRLVKFYSMMTQAIKLSEIDNGDVRTWKESGWEKDEDGNYLYAVNSQKSKEYFMKYLAPYIKYTKFVDGYDSISDDGVKSGAHPTVYFADGTTMFLANSVCMDFGYDINGQNPPNTYGKDKFHFVTCFNDEYRTRYCGGDVKTSFCVMSDPNAKTREEKIEKCLNNQRYCADLIKYDGWKISKDYPW